jgi:regulator-associated protein of mTOR
MYELQTWLGTPCIYVLDCSASGLIINNFRGLMETRQQQLALQQQQVGNIVLTGLEDGMECSHY